MGRFATIKAVLSCALLLTVLALPTFMAAGAIARYASPQVCVSVASDYQAPIDYKKTTDILSGRSENEAPPAGGLVWFAFVYVWYFMLVFVLLLGMTAALLLYKTYLIIAGTCVALVTGSRKLLFLRQWPFWGLAGIEVGAVLPIIFGWHAACPSVQHMAYPLTGLVCGLIARFDLRRVLAIEPSL
jgi:hypothetical protein